MNIRTAVGLTFVIAVGSTIGTVVGFFVTAMILAVLRALV